MAILVTGGAGYIGSHMALELLDRGEEVLILDNLSTGIKSNIPKGAMFVYGDISDADLVRGILRKHQIRELAHFAAKTVVPESVRDPIKYYRDNTAASISLFDTVYRHSDVERIIFSSTAAVYAPPDQGQPIREDHPVDPLSPYGASKLFSERVLHDISGAGGARCVVFRYFNVAGADPKGRSGQSTPEATHLIKVACEAAVGKRDRLIVHGSDWPTHDGTGVRDFIHVTDLVNAHIDAIDYLRAGGESVTLNLGYGKGFSVRDVISQVEWAAGRRIPVEEGPRRPGDLPEVIADPGLAKDVLGWRPTHNRISDIIRSALDWEEKVCANYYKSTG